MDHSLVTPTSLLSIPDARTITAKSRSNFSSAFVFLPKRKRLAIHRVYAFFRIIDDVVDEEDDIHKKQELLGSWKRELANAYNGTSIVPLLGELKETIDEFNIPREYFMLLIEGCEMDFCKNRYANFAELYEYCYRVASMVGLVCMKIFEYESRTSAQSAIDLGLALQLTNIIRDVGVDLQKNRIYIPQEELRQFGVQEADLFAHKGSPAFVRLMEFQYARAREYFDRGLAEIAHDPGFKLLAAHIMGRVYESILTKIRKKNFPVLTTRVRLHFAEKMFLLAMTLVRHVKIRSQKSFGA